MGFLMVLRYLVAMKSSSVLATIAMVMISAQALDNANLDGYVPVPPVAIAGQPAAPPPLAAAATSAEQPAAAPPPAIFVFGDGALDVGNNNDLTGGEIGDPDRANYPYYGIDYPGGQATGRFSNGYNIADFIGTHHLPICML